MKMIIAVLAAVFAFASVQAPPTEAAAAGQPGYGRYERDYRYNRGNHRRWDRRDHRRWDRRARGHRRWDRRHRYAMRRSHLRARYRDCHYSRRLGARYCHWHRR